MITDAQKALIADSWRLIVPIADTAADVFYKRLFEIRPEYRSLFDEDLATQKTKLVEMLDFVVKALDWPAAAWREWVTAEDDLFLVVLAMGRRHSELYHVPDAAYDAVGEALLFTLDYGLGKKFDAAVRAAWTHVYQLLAMAMRMGRLSVQGRSYAEDSLERIVAIAAISRASHNRDGGGLS